MDKFTNCRLRREALDRLRAYARDNGWTLSYALERALDAAGEDLVKLHAPPLRKVSRD